MKYKNVIDLSKSYYPSKTEIERYAFENFFDDHCESKHKGDIMRSLMRAGIDSIEKLHRASIDEIKKANHIGDRKMESIIKMKEFITSRIEEAS